MGEDMLEHRVRHGARPPAGKISEELGVGQLE
jgi:hypothetical protein